LERRGTPTITICTDEFLSLAKIEAEVLRMPRLPVAIIPHPLGGLKPEEVEEKAKVAFQEILSILD